MAYKCSNKADSRIETGKQRATAWMDEGNGSTVCKTNVQH